MVTQWKHRGRPVFSTRRVGDDAHAPPHRVVLCGIADRAVPLETCQACSSYRTLDATTPGGPCVRCDEEELAHVPDLEGEANTVPVTAIMRRKTTSIAPDADLEVAHALLVELDLGGLAVVDAEQRPLGMITVTDLVRDQALARCGGLEVDDVCAVAPELRVTQPQAVRVGEVMTQFAFSVPERTTVAHAAGLMAEEGIHRLPVVAQDGRLVGIVTALDVMGWIAQRARLRTAR